MTSTNGLMAGKKGLIMGVANDRSIAWGIAKAVADAGAELAFTFQGEALQKRVLPLAQSVGSDWFDLSRLAVKREKQNESAMLKPWYVGKAVGE